MAILLWLKLISVWFDFILSVSSSRKNHIIYAMSNETALAEVVAWCRLGDKSIIWTNVDLVN